MLRRVLGRCFSTQLLTWGPTTYGWARPVTDHLWTPTKAETPDNIVSVATGKTHLGFITSEHAAYACGLEDFKTETETPRKLEFEGNPSIASLACGTRHSLAVSTDGAVFGWGDSHAIRDGTSKPSRIPQEHFGNQKVVSVTAGEETSFALTEDGSVYAWGYGLIRIP